MKKLNVRWIATSEWHWYKADNPKEVLAHVTERAHGVMPLTLASYLTECEDGDWQDDVYTDSYMPCLSSAVEGVSRDLHIVAVDKEQFVDWDDSYTAERALDIKLLKF